MIMKDGETLYKSFIEKLLCFSYISSPFTLAEWADEDNCVIDEVNSDSFISK